ncbi:hypothetical protein C4D60_Mb01t16520 [Musa balbisiana]|uniref:ZF-HD dimerization-type domain-containing protein n=1 Tax=Musa balbisiana TaxID=52838 RepID=A0A4V4H7E3_MUSBA|nr:hypothetical protein C4D60_Mb01t16520 [Musa balbisiana]
MIMPLGAMQASESDEMEGVGGNATDGCGEFMPSGEEGTLEALKCSACSCHRNFHRKEAEGEPSCDCFQPIRWSKMMGAFGYSPASRSFIPRATPHSMIMPLGAMQASESDEMEGVVVKYRECLKNHAASIGGNATDGCGEFMPSGEEGTLEALKCSACSCHRNFHRKEAEGEPSCDCFQPIRWSKRRGDGKASHGEEEVQDQVTPEQKEKMLSFAEKLGWRLQKQEESLVQQFCQEIG